MNITIHKAQLSNLEEVSKLFDAYRVFYKQKSDVSLALDFLTQRLENAESVIFYAKNDHDEYFGFTQLYPTFSSVSACSTWVLNDLFVTPNSRGLGIGNKLLDKAKEFAQEKNAKGLALSTAKTNEKAQKLYESLGYEKDNEYLHYFLSV
ncbi:MAG: GNAT family N-acetyltransferase [Campylobacteraceae bacterium]|nr:GNAT family N-acetyltransferase [Campylobacteraceae bacterium]